MLFMGEVRTDEDEGLFPLALEMWSLMVRTGELCVPGPSLLLSSLFNTPPIYQQHTCGVIVAFIFKNLEICYRIKTRILLYARAVSAQRPSMHINRKTSLWWAVWTHAQTQTRAGTEIPRGFLGSERDHGRAES